MHSETALLGLIKDLNGENWTVKEAEIKALVKQQMLSETTVSALYKDLENINCYIKRAAAEALGKFQTLPETAILFLIKALEDKDKGWMVNEQAAQVLGRQKMLSEDAILALINALWHIHDKIREAAVDILGQQQTLSDRAVLDLIAALNDKSWDVRFTVAEVLSSYIGGIFTLLPRLKQNQVEALYAQFLFPRSCRKTLPLYIQTHQLHFYTETGPGQPIELSAEQSRVIKEAFKIIQAKAGIISSGEENWL